ncbi:MAG: calcium-binding protein [Leptolyngbya sp. SIOISBB]|nr:calcium-binding protein [Leptolyngbya sp. SIOISBB]
MAKAISKEPLKVSDRIYENANEGIDTVISHSFSYKLADHVEELRLSTWDRSPGGSSGWGYHGYGNDQANKLYGNVKDNKLRGYGGADLLVGDAGKDTLEDGTGSDALDGGAGADRMYGGTQSDVYYVDSWSDAVYEYAGEGDNDVVYSCSFSYKLALNVERLYLSEGASPYGRCRDCLQRLWQ